MGRRWLEWPSHLPTGFLRLFLALWPSSYCTSSAKIHPPIHPPDGRVSRVVGKNSVWPHAEWERGKRGSNIELGINPRWQKCASLAAWDSVSLDSALRKWVMQIAVAIWRRRSAALHLSLSMKASKWSCVIFALDPKNWSVKINTRKEKTKRQTDRFGKNKSRTREMESGSRERISWPKLTVWAWGYFWTLTFAQHRHLTLVYFFSKFTKQILTENGVRLDWKPF